MASTTRIADLPENITMSIHPPVQPGQGFTQGFQQVQGQASMAGGIPSINTRQQPEEHNPVYTQMNVHPNPYGNPQQPQMMPLPQQTQSPYMQQDAAPQYRLPSRDIPLDTESYMQDEAIQPNYIPPPPKLTGDYIRDYADEVEVEVRNHKQKKHKERMMDNFLTEFQIPIFVAILFFIFQMPVVNTLLYKRFSFLSIYDADGNFNFYGLFLKSAAFGSAFYSLSRIIDYVGSM